MLNLIKFEMKKIYRSSFFIIMLLILFLCMIGYYTFVHINTVTSEEIILERETRISNYENQLREIEISIEEGEIEADDQDVMNEIQFLTDFKEGFINEVELYEEEDWAGLLNMEIEQDEPHVENRLVRADWSSALWPTLFTEITRLEYYKLLREREIEPVLPIGDFFWMTAYDTVFDSPQVQDSITSLNTIYSSSGTNYLHHVFEVLFGVIGAVFFLFLFGDIITKEGMGKSGSIHLLRTQPIHKDKILTGKLISILLMTFLILLAAILFSLLLGTLFDRLGDWNYPVLIYGEDYSFTFMNLSTYLLQEFILFFMLLLFVYSLLFFFSVLIKRGLVAVCLTLAKLFIGIEISSDSVLSPLAAYVPFHYFSVTDVVTKELALAADNFSFSIESGVLVLGMTSLALLLLTYVISVLEYKYWRT